VKGKLPSSSEMKNDLSLAWAAKDWKVPVEA